jgi:hypothetical protein
MNTQKNIFIFIENFSLLIINNFLLESSIKWCQNEYKFNNNKTNFKTLRISQHFFLRTLYFFSSVWSNSVFVAHQMSFLITQNDQNFSSIFKTYVYREYDHIHHIINENKRRKVDKSKLESIHNFLWWFDSFLKRGWWNKIFSSFSF